MARSDIKTITTTRHQLKAIQPTVKAYSLGYASWITPRLLKFATRARQLRRYKDPDEYYARLETLKQDFIRTLKKSIELNRFPAFCGIVAGGLTVLQPIIEKALQRQVHNYRQRQELATFLASTFSSAAGLTILLQDCSKDASRPTGRTIDLTIFAAVRALDVLVGTLWQKNKNRRIKEGKFTRVESLVGSMTDATVFALSSGMIMFTWIYTPEKLPTGYRRWITDIANAEPRLVEALRRVRRGEFIYGKEMGQAELLSSYCRDLGLPEDLGDPVKTVPLPCQVVHDNATSSCEVHAIHRFLKAFRPAFLMYITLNLLVRIRSPSLRSFAHAVKNSVRSSSFLAAFIGMFWYTVCLTRTRLGPMIQRIGGKPYDATVLEGLEGPLACAACGWSILIETAKRQAEIAFFVAPRAIAGLLPRTYDRKDQWKEVLVFALSTGTVLTVAKHKPKQVRGVLGRVLSSVLGSQI